MMTRQLLTLAVASLFSTAALAQVTVTDPWVRATVPAQKSSGAFMQLRSAGDARLVGVRSSAAGMAELHRMDMQGHAMTMRPVDSIALPAGQVVNLASGGYHVMLFDLKHQLKEGETVPLTLVVEDAQHKRSEVNVTATVKPLGYAGARAH
jgi:copper(I)-binding protein